MATSSNGDAKNVKLGVCKVTFNSVDLGFTKGGVEVTVETETHEVTVDQMGNTPINEYIIGRTCTVKVPLAETTLENMVAVMPGAKLITDSTDPTKKKVEVPTGTGLNLLDFAQTLNLHPIAKDAADKSDDFTVNRAGTAGALNYSYMLDDERIYNVEFKAYPDADGRLFVAGDTTAVDL
ncbi:hypothetical protein [Achromobacter sp. AGC39]